MLVLPVLDIINHICYCRNAMINKNYIANIGTNSACVAPVFAPMLTTSTDPSVLERREHITRT
jgi:hypothetical protein